MSINFGNISNRLQKYERAKAKLNEFAVTDEDRNANKLGQTSSDELLYSTIRTLSQFADAYCKNCDTESLYNDLTFISNFYENYSEGEIRAKGDYFYLLTGAIANILADNFGNAKTLIVKIDRLQEFNPVACFVFEYISYALGIFYETSYIPDNLREELYFNLIREIRSNEPIKYLYKLKEFSHNLLMTEDPESSFFSLMVYAVHKKFLQNSAVRNIPQKSNSSLLNWRKYFSQKNSITILWQAQMLLLKKDILTGKDATIQLPTGVGKTRSIELIISAAFLLRDVSLAIVIAPLRALCNEIEKDLQKALKNIVEITALSDVLDDEEFDFTQKRVVVLTPEKLSFLIKHNSDIITKSGLIIFDEAHMFDDQSRGATYELLILQVKEYLSENSQKVFISAVMPNAIELNEWLTTDGAIVADKEIKKTEKSIGFFSKHKNQLTFFQQNDLIDQQNEIVYIPKICPRTPDFQELNTRGKNIGKPKYVFPDVKKGADVALYLASKLSSKENCSAIYVNKPSAILSIAKNINKLKSINYPLLDNITKQSLNSANIKICELAKKHFGEDYDLVKIMSLGYFPHFGDLENGLRISIEYEVKNHNIICVICTSTLAEGVNLPIRYLFLTSLKDAFGQLISIRKFQNLIGRTARSGVHTEGSLICTSCELIDEKNNDPTMWQNVVNLFDPSKSEHCNSTLLQMFDNLTIPFTDKSIKGTALLHKYLDAYMLEERLNFDSLIDNIVKLIPSRTQAWANKNKRNLRNEIGGVIQSKIVQIDHIVEVIEALLMGVLAKEAISPIEIENIYELYAKKTLAYKLADDEKKTLIIGLFSKVAEKILRIPIEKRVVFSKTLNGISILNTIDSYLKDNPHLYINCTFDAKSWINFIVDLSQIYLSSSSKFNMLTIELKSQLIELWINGITYKEMSDTTGLKIEDIIKICQKDMGYEFNLLLSCAIELLNQYMSENISEVMWSNFLNEMTVFQKRIKYGLLRKSDIAAYEFGYADRIIAKEVGTLLYNLSDNSDIEIYKAMIKMAKEQIIDKLKIYPNYFSKVISLV